MILSGTTIQGGRYVSPIIGIPGLRFMLDAQDYPGSGDTWPAVIGPDATLFNAPSYTATAPTYFSFNPNNLQYASAPDLGSLSNWTIEAWFRATADLAGKITMVFGNEFNSGNINYLIAFNISPPTFPPYYGPVMGYYRLGWNLGEPVSIMLNTWFQFAATFNGNKLRLFNQGSQYYEIDYSDPSFSGGELRIAKWWGSGPAGPENFFPGDVALLRIYDYALSAAEVNQNWHASRSRFGLG